MSRELESVSPPPPTPSLSSPLSPHTNALTVVGYNNGVISGLLVLPSFISAFHLPPPGTPAYNTIIENIVSLLQIGGLVGAMATFPGMKYWGRRWALVISAGVYGLGAGLQVCTFFISSVVLSYYV